MASLDDYFGGNAEADPNVNSRQDAMRVMVGSFRTTKPTETHPILQVVFPDVPEQTLVTIKGYLTYIPGEVENAAFTLVGVQIPSSQVGGVNEQWGMGGTFINISHDSEADVITNPIKVKLGYTSTKLPQIEFTGHTIHYAGDGEIVIESIVYDGLTKETAPPPTLSFTELTTSSIPGVTSLTTKNAANEKHKHTASDIAPTLLTDTVNLNTLKTPGRYYQSLPLLTTWQSLNYPFQPPCSVVIEKTNGVVQIVYGGESSPGKLAMRPSKSDGSWDTWTQNIDTNKKDLFIFRGQATDLNTVATRLPGHYDILNNNNGPVPAQYGHMHVTGNGLSSGTGAWIQQTLFYHDGTIHTRRLVNPTTAATTQPWDRVMSYNSLLESGVGVRVTKATNPFFEWHVPGVKAYMTYLDHTDGRLVTGQSNGAAGLSSFTHWQDARGVNVFNGNLWAANWSHGYNSQFSTIAPLHVDFGQVAGNNDYYPIVRGKGQAAGAGYTTQVELGMLRSGDYWGQGVLLVGSGEGSTPQAVYSFDINGNVNIPGEMSFTDYTIRCDRKFKTKLVKIKDPLAKLDNVHGYTFINQQGEEDSGLVSNEWTWLPGATKIKPLSDKHGNLIEGEEYVALRLKGPVGFMLECIKYQREQITTLTTRLELLEKHLGITVEE